MASTHYCGLPNLFVFLELFLGGFILTCRGAALPECTQDDCGEDLNSMIQTPVVARKSGGYAIREELLKRDLDSEHLWPITNLSAANAHPWDGGKVLGLEKNCNCKWSLLKGGLKMCVRNYPDVVSSNITRNGEWGDCVALESWWTSLANRSGRSGAEYGKFFVDIGANIGACLLSMLSRSDVQNALAFEPSSTNLFYLTNSILANTGIGDKVKLYPVALGDEHGTKPLYTERGNAGNTVVGKVIHTSTVSSMITQVFKLDDIVMNSDSLPYIHLMKMDAQGYEVKILKGASRLFASGAVNAVKFEVATDWLKGQNTSTAEYLNTYMGYNFQIYSTSTKKLLSQAQLHSVACGPPVVKDFMAVLIEKGVDAIQKPIVC